MNETEMGLCVLNGLNVSHQWMYYLAVYHRLPYWCRNDTCFNTVHGPLSEYNKNL